LLAASLGFAITAESESNNTEATADGPLVSGTTVNASIASSTDVDWYYFDNTSTGNIVVSLNHTSGRDFDFYLYRDSGAFVLSGQSSARPETGTYAATTTGRWYVKIQRYSGTGAYTLNVTFPGGGTPPPPPPPPPGGTITTETETNNSQAAANGPMGSGTAVSGSIASTSDADWFYFDTTATGSIGVTLSHATGRDFDFQLFGSGTSAVLTRATSAIPETGSYSATVTGRWWVRVHRYSGTGAYTLTVTLPTGGGDPPPPPPTGFGPRPSLPSGLTVFVTGNSADKDVTPVNGPAVVLMGGNFDTDETFINRVYPVSNGGDVVVIRSSGTNGYNDYLYNLVSGATKPDSVETIVIDSVTKANSDYVYWACRTAEFIYFAGGDQSTYVNYYAGTKVETGLKEMYARGGVIGGISAGCAIMGQFIYDPDGVTAAISSEAVANPYRSSMIISNGFANGTQMANIVTDTHFQQRDRMGRLMAFMARLRQDGRASAIVGVGVSEDTCLFVDKNRVGTVDGDSTVYVLTEDAQTQRVQVTSGSPLVYTNVLRTKLTVGQNYNFATNATTGATIRLSVDGRNSSAYTPVSFY